MKDVDSPAIWAWRFLKEEVRLRGSTGALLRTLPSGKRVVVKRGGREGNDPQAHIRNEYDMNRYLHELGVGVPHAEMVEEEDRPTMISDFEEGARPVRYSDAPALRQDFVPQALIANWDTLGQEMDNVLIRPDGTPTYVDVGGAGPYRARGAPKGDWGDVDTELASMQYYAPHTSQIYGDMTGQEMYDSYNRYGGLPAYLNAANVINDPQTKNILTQRAQDLARRID